MAAKEVTHGDQVQSGERFEFGRNWARFLKHVDDQRIREAESSLRKMLDVSDLTGRRFLDIGSGSGLFSLAARRLGARVHSLDLDPESVACTTTLRSQFFPDDPQWVVERGSALDASYLQSLGPADVVYAWGVLHHTGAMWEAIDNVMVTVAPNGLFYIMIYMDRGIKSRIWLRVKRFYCRGVVGRIAVLGIFIPYYVLRGFVEDILRFQNPMRRYREYKRQRGMSKLYDWVDWLGGYPYEFATPQQITEFCERRGFHLVRRQDEEYLFRRASA